MTLALYGKSKRRQGSLLLLGVFVVMLTLAVTLVASRDARAASLTLDDVDAGWSNAVGASPTITTNTDFTVARWGTEDDNSCVSASALATHFLGGSSDDRSGYIFDSDDTGRTFNDGEVISLGAFTHVNCPITGSSIDSIDLGLTLDFSAPASESLTLPFTFSHWETPNNPQSGTCANGGANNSGVNANGCADRVQVSGTPSDEFKVGDDLYKLQFVGFANSSDAYATACPTPGSTSPSLEFWTVEGQLNFACLYAKIIYSRPVIEVIKTPDAGTVPAGTAVEFTIQVKNNGDAAATNVGVTDTLPAALTWTDNSGDCSISSGVLSCTIPSLAPGATFEVKVSAPTSTQVCGVYNNTAALTTHGQDTDDGQVTVECPPDKGNLIIGKVKDLTTGVPAADSTLFGGTIVGTGVNETWSGVGFGLFSSPIAVTAGVQLTVDENSPTSGWTEVGWAQGSGSPTAPQCPADKASYSGSNIGANLQVNTTMVLCVMNTKTAPSTPKLTIVKDVISGTGTHSQDFTFTVFHRDPSPAVQIGGTVTLDDDPTSATPQSEQISLPAIGGDDDTYRITEGSLPNGWSLDSISCTGATGTPSVDTGDRRVDIKVNSNTQEVTCTFKNKQKTAKIIVKKSVSGTAGVDYPDVTFPVQIRDTRGTSGTGDDVLYNGSIKEGTNYTEIVLDIDDGVSFDNDNFIVTESLPTPSAGWSVVGWKFVSNESSSCGTSSYTSGATASGGSLNGMDNGDTVVICFRNAYTPPDRNLTICKVVEGNGDLAVRSGQFKFDYYPQGGTTLNVAISASEPNPDQVPGAAGTKVCTTQPIPMPVDKQLTVTEWTGVRPAGWDTSANDAALYPKVQLGAGAISNNVSIDIPAGTSDVTVTFYNREKLPTKNVTFQKYICNSLGDVARNQEAGGIDQVGMPSISSTGGLSAKLKQTNGPAGNDDPVNPDNDGRGNCHLWGTGAGETGNWDMEIWNNSRGSLLQTVNIPAGGTISVPLTDAVLLETLKAGSDGARVEEVFKTGYGFASLKCYTDHKNQDNWEWLDFNPGGIPTGEVYCIAYNVPADKQITIEKRFVELNGTVPTVADVPGFTLDPSANTSCAAPVQQNATTWTVTCTVHYDWNGTVAETLPLPAGWQQTKCTAETQTTEQNLRFTFCNRPVGTVVVVKYENVPPATTQTWNFNGTVPGAPVALQTTGTTNATGTASTTLTNVPAGSYTLAELQGRGQCESGTTSSDYQTRGLTSSSLPSATDVNGAPIIGANDLNVTVQKGATTYVAFGNQGCGTVLSAANLQVFKYSDPAANFTGTTELGGWTISITGTAGAATGFNASEDTVLGTGAFFLGIPDGTYTVCETAKTNWAVVGSKYNATNQAGVCRTGVVVALDQTVVVNFYNQPRVNIEVNKTEISLATPSGAPGNGWNFTLSGCGVGPLSQATAANGKATFTDLPPAVGCSYTVTETVKSGWSAINPVQVTAPATAGQTSVLNFTNVKIEVCIDCTPTTTTPTPTPETPTPEKPTPTATATPEKPTDPTATPTEEPTEKPTEDIVSGEKTPGPGQTPLAPSAGNGLMGGGAGGVNMLMALVGLLALSLGSTILAIGRKSSRR